MAGTGVLVAALACEVLRDRLVGGKGVRVLVSHAGRVTVDLTELIPSSKGGWRRDTGVVTCRRLDDRGWWCNEPSETSREPNLAFADDSRP